MVCVVPPLLHKKVNGPFPPIGVAVALPSMVAFTKVEVVVTESGTKTGVWPDCVAVQPFPSVTLTDQLVSGAYGGFVGDHKNVSGT